MQTFRWSLNVNLRMPNNRRSTKNFYYTKEHEWICFRKDYAYVGVSDFKLSGIGTILHISLQTLSLNKEKGEILGTIISGDYRITIHMPVNGKIVDYNELLLSKPELITDASLHNRWLVKIKTENNQHDPNLIPSDLYLEKTQRLPG